MQYTTGPRMEHLSSHTNHRPNRTRVASRRVREATEIGLPENISTLRSHARPLASLSHDSRTTVTTRTNLDSDGHRRIRTQSRKAREIEMQNDESLRRRLPNIAPAFTQHTGSTIVRIPHLPLLAPKGGVAPDVTTLSPASITQFPLIAPMGGLTLDDAAISEAPTVSSMDAMPQLAVLAPMGGHMFDDRVSIENFKLSLPTSCLCVL